MWATAGHHPPHNNPSQIEDGYYVTPHPWLLVKETPISLSWHQTPFSFVPTQSIITLLFFFKLYSVSQPCCKIGGARINIIPIVTA